MFKFIHAADLHLDSPLKGLERYEGAPVEEIRGAAREALKNLVKLAIEQGVDFVVISGDIYDGDWPDINTGLFFTQQARDLRDADIPLFLISGNHDAQNKMTRSLRLPESVTFFSASQPETATIPELDVAIHGQSYATRAVTEDLSASYPAAVAGMFNIGMLHTSADGREGHAPYAPCTLEGLKTKGYHYWALGHVHTREVLSESPYVVFPGNIQGRHIRETGPKGCMLVTVDDDWSLTPEFKALDVLRWELLSLDVDGMQDVDDMLEVAKTEIEKLLEQAEERPLALRVECRGTTGIHRQLHAKKLDWLNELRNQATDVGRGNVWIEKFKLKTHDQSETSGSRDDVSESAAGAIEELSALFRSANQDHASLIEYGFKVDDVVKKLPAKLKTIINTDDKEWMASVLADAESLLNSQLLGTGGENEDS